jgi:hypothetical protein
MNKNDIIKQEVQKTLDFLRPLGELPANPYFYTRLQATINSRQQQVQMQMQSIKRENIFSSRLWRPALIGLIVLLNLSTAIIIYSSNDQTKDYTNDTLTALATDYNLGQDDSDLFSISK